MRRADNRRATGICQPQTGAAMFARICFAQGVLQPGHQQRVSIPVAYPARQPAQFDPVRQVGRVFSCPSQEFRVVAVGGVADDEDPVPSRAEAPVVEPIRLHVVVAIPGADASGPQCPEWGREGPSNAQSGRGDPRNETCPPGKWKRMTVDRHEPTPGARTMPEIGAAG